MSTAGIIAINQLPLADAMKVFGRCCGSSAWAMQLARGRPYQDLTELMRFADLKFRSLTRKDWLEAFIHIPDVAEIVKAHREGVRAAVPSSEGVDLERLIDRIERMSVRYQRRFGHKFIPLDENAGIEVLASEIVSRYRNTPDRELELVCFNRRNVALRHLGAIITNYRPQEGDGVVVASSVTGEQLQKATEEVVVVPVHSSSSSTTD